MLSMKKFLPILLLLIIPACGNHVTPTPPSPPTPIPGPGNGGWVPPVVDTSVSKILAGINEARAGKDLPALVLESHLMSAAKMQSNNMAKLEDLSHTLPVPGEQTMEQRVADCGYTNWIGIAENIAWNYTLENVVQGWLDSPGHYANIMGDYTETGIAVTNDSNGQPYYTQTFGKR